MNKEDMERRVATRGAHGRMGLDARGGVAEGSGKGNQYRSIRATCREIEDKKKLIMTQN